MEAAPCIQLIIRHRYLRTTLGEALAELGYSIEPMDHGWPRRDSLVLATDVDIAIADCAVMTGCAMLVIVLLLHDSEIRRRQYEKAGAICIGVGAPLSALVSAVNGALARQSGIPVVESDADAV